MRYRRLVRIILCSSLLLFAAQFAVFRARGVFDLTLLSYLYDNASWVTEKPRVLLMGSSRCFHQLVPRVIADLNGLERTDVANIGQVAAGPFEMLHSYTKHIDLFDEAEFVFYVLDADFFFESSHVDSPYERILLGRKQWELVSGVYGNFYHLPVVLFANAIRGSPRKTGVDMGFEGLPHLDFLNMTFEDRNSPFRLDLENFPLSDFQVDSMRKIKELCEANGGILVFVLTPFWDIDALEDEFFDRTDILVRALDDALGPTRLVGSWEREEYELEYADFMDNSHLSASGSEKVTARIFGDLESIRSQRPALLSGRVPAGAAKRADRN